MTLVLGTDISSLYGDSEAERFEREFGALAGLGASPQIHTVARKRVLRGNSDGTTQWLAEPEAAPILKDLEAAGRFVSVPNALGDSFDWLPNLALPWPPRGAWREVHAGFKLRLPGTKLDGLSFGAAQYLISVARGGHGGDEVGACYAQIGGFLRALQRHKVVGCWH